MVWVWVWVWGSGFRVVCGAGVGVGFRRAPRARACSAPTASIPTGSTLRAKGIYDHVYAFICLSPVIS